MFLLSGDISDLLMSTGTIETLGKGLFDFQLYRIVVACQAEP